MCSAKEFKQLAFNILKDKGLSAIGFFFAIWVYMDMQESNMRMTEITREQTRAMTEVTEVLRQLTEKIERTR